MKDYEKKIINLKGFDGEIRLLPIRQEYAKGGLAVDLYDVDTLEPYAVMTVNLINSKSPNANKGNVAFVDTNNCPGQRSSSRITDWANRRDTSKALAIAYIRNMSSTKANSPAKKTP